MQRLINILLLVLVLVNGTPCFAVSSLSHRLGVGLDGGYSTNLYANSEIKTQGGAGGLALVYELQQYHFLFQTSLSAQYKFMQFTLPNQQANLPDITDDDGDVAMMRLTISNRKISDKVIMPRLNIMFGGSWNIVYFLIGGHIGVSMYHTYTYQTTYSTSSKYTFFDSELSNMPQHGLVSNHLHSNTGHLASSLTGNAAAELGAHFKAGNRSSAPMIRLGLFGEYDLSRLYSTKPEYMMQPTNYANVPYSQLPSYIQSSVNQCMSTFLSNSSWSRLTVGIRLTILFNLHTGPHYRCMCIPN